jgi:hypothetical protein
MRWARSAWSVPVGTSWPSRCAYSPSVSATRGQSSRLQGQVRGFEVRDGRGRQSSGLALTSPFRSGSSGPRDHALVKAVYGKELEVGPEHFGQLKH